MRNKNLGRKRRGETRVAVKTGKKGKLDGGGGGGREKGKW